MGVPVRGLDLVRVASPTEGTGSLALGNAASGFLHPSTPALGAVSGGRYPFLQMSADRLTWELIEGVLTSGSPWTLTREVVLTSAGNSTPINWSNTTHGARTLTCVPRALRSALYDTDGRLPWASLPISFPQRAGAYGASSYDLRTVNDAFFDIAVDANTVAIVGGSLVRLEMLQTTAVVGFFDVALRNAANTADELLFASAGLATALSGQNGYPTAFPTFSFAIPAGTVAGQRLRFYGRKGSAVGPFNVLNYTGHALFVTKVV